MKFKLSFGSFSTDRSLPTLSPPLQKSPQTESSTDSGAENEGSCHSDQLSNDFSADDCVDEGICLDGTGSAERVLKPKVAQIAAIFA